MRLCWIAIAVVALVVATSNCGGIPNEGDPGDDPSGQGQGEGEGDPLPGDDAGSGGDQVTICHRPPGNPGNAHTITVGVGAVAAHLKHGDTLGACPSGEGGGGKCGAMGAKCRVSSTCCAGLTCVDDNLRLCEGDGCTCQAIIN
ncbi:MAG TPA: hypothetical protein VIG99_25040 [Myxococcaceae bacterium]|jgi:hypothetical protein